MKWTPNVYALLWLARAQDVGVCLLQTPDSSFLAQDQAPSAAPAAATTAAVTTAAPTATTAAAVTTAAPAATTAAAVTTAAPAVATTAAVTTAAFTAATTAAVATAAPAAATTVGNDLASAIDGVRSSAGSQASGSPTIPATPARAAGVGPSVPGDVGDLDAWLARVRAGAPGGYQQPFAPVAGGTVAAVHQHLRSLIGQIHSGANRKALAEADAGLLSAAQSLGDLQVQSPIPAGRGLDLWTRARAFVLSAQSQLPAGHPGGLKIARVQVRRGAGEAVRAGIMATVRRGDGSASRLLAELDADGWERVPTALAIRLTLPVVGSEGAVHAWAAGAAFASADAALDLANVGEGKAAEGTEAWAWLRLASLEVALGLESVGASRVELHPQLLRGLGGLHGDLQAGLGQPGHSILLRGALDALLRSLGGADPRNVTGVEEPPANSPEVFGDSLLNYVAAYWPWR